MSVITEGNVSKNILSFTGDEFLFTTTVCRSWQCNSVAKCTSISSIVQSVSRVQEAIESGVNTEYLFDIAVVLRARLPVLQCIRLGPCLHTVTLRYAAFHGRVDVVQYIQNMGPYELYEYDQFDLFEAIRGGHIGAVKQVLSEGECPINTIPEWPPSDIEEDPSEDTDGILQKSGTEGELWFLGHCMNKLDSHVEIQHDLDRFINDRFYHPEDAISCMELAIRKNRLDIVKLLRENGGEFEEESDTFGSFARAMRQGNCEMLVYLKDAGCVIEDCTLYEYTGAGRGFDMSVVEFVLQHRLVKIDEGCLSMAIYHGRMDLLELLLQHEAPVCDDHVDKAVAKRNFSLVDRLMRVHGCRPTPRAYEFVLTRGASEDSLQENGIEDTEGDAFYLQKLNWLYSTGCRPEFHSFDEMETDFWKWGLILSYFGEAVVGWFREHLH